MSIPEHCPPADVRWTTTVGDGFIVLSVAPEVDVADVFESMVPADRRHLWIIEAYADDDYTGQWNRWLLSRY